jgi:hypothetical protein
VREALQQQVAKGLLMSVLPVGRQAMVEPEEWPGELPVAVRGWWKGSGSALTGFRLRRNIRGFPGPNRRPSTVADL